MGRSITVTGKASVTLTADLCTVDVTVEEKSKDYGKASSSVGEKTAALRGVCEKLGLLDRLKTSSYNVRTEYTGVNENGVYRNVFDGYVCSCTSSVSFDFDGHLLSSLIDGLALCGADARINVSFSVKDPSAAEAGLLEAVCDDAKRKVDVICRRLDAYPGKLIRVEQGGLSRQMRSNTEFAFDEAAPMMAKAARFSPDVTPSDVTISSEAVFEWELL